MGAVRARALDADLAALLWLLVDGDLPLVVAGGTSDQRATLLAALGGLPGARNDAPDHIAPNGVWGSVLRGRIASLRPGDRFRATAEVGSLRELLELLDGPAIGLTDDEIRTLSVILVLDAEGRVAAAHLLRPVERDGAGHLQRRPPAVLAARDSHDGELEHFTWAVTSELADRVDRSQPDFEARQAGRARLIDHLASNPASTGDRAALEAHLSAEPPRQPAPERPPARPPWPPPDDHRPH
ncbi:MAG: hypothetical protein WKF46_01110 [Candidatus Limnocylindrales bacterium]|nr:hypothetical protein [Chloroflexota bacterium]